MSTIISLNYDTNSHYVFDKQDVISVDLKTKDAEVISATIVFRNGDAQIINNVTNLEDVLNKLLF